MASSLSMLPREAHSFLHTEQDWRRRLIMVVAGQTGLRHQLLFDLFLDLKSVVLVTTIVSLEHELSQLTIFQNRKKRKSTLLES